MMLRKRSRGPAIGPELPIQFVNFLEYSMIFFSVFYWIVESLILKDWELFIQFLYCQIRF